MATPLNKISGMPQMNAAFFGWTTKITIVRIAQMINDALVTDTPFKMIFQGVVQPLTPEQLKTKPEGERSWEWIMIHMVGKKKLLANGDKIIYNNITYKVMQSLDYTLNNYCEYHIIRDFGNV